MGVGSSSEEGEPPAPAAPAPGAAGGEAGGGPEAEQDYNNLSYWEMAKLGYQELVNAIIRPPRAEYEVEHLGPPAFEWHGARFRRTDLELVNERGMRLQCSWWEPAAAAARGGGGARPERQPCVVYMHGNSSARVEAISQLALCLSIGASLFALDMAGSGQSDGEWVTLGYYEREARRALPGGRRRPFVSARARFVASSSLRVLSRRALSARAERSRFTGTNKPTTAELIATALIFGAEIGDAQPDVTGLSTVSRR